MPSIVSGGIVAAAVAATGVLAAAIARDPLPVTPPAPVRDSATAARGGHLAAQPPAVVTVYSYTPAPAVAPVAAGPSAAPAPAPRAASAPASSAPVVQSTSS